MKEEYIEKLIDELKEKGIYDESIIKKYKEFYNLGLEALMTDEEIVQKLGKPEDVASNIYNDLYKDDDIVIKSDTYSSNKLNIDENELYSIEINVLSSDVEILVDDSIDKPEIDMDDLDISCYKVINNNNEIVITENKSIFKGGSDITISVPSDYNINSLKITTKSGDINVEEIKAMNVEITTQSGDLEIEELTSKNISFTTVSGDISCEVLSSDVITINTKSGDIEIDIVNSKTFTCRTESGDLEIEDSNIENKDIKTLSGDIIIN